VLLFGLPFLYWFSWSQGVALAKAYFSGQPIPFAKHSILAWSIAAFGSSFSKPTDAYGSLFWVFWKSSG